MLGKVRPSDTAEIFVSAGLVPLLGRVGHGNDSTGGLLGTPSAPHPWEGELTSLVLNKAWRVCCQGPKPPRP